MRKRIIIEIDYTTIPDHDMQELAPNDIREALEDTWDCFSRLKVKRWVPKGVQPNEKE